jgi:acetylornithine deacetylase/succinyl-diaminopimelate desuccinylase-like protein
MQSGLKNFLKREERMDEKGWREIKEEAVQTLSKYIQFNTTNPPGNELPAAEFLGSILKREGIDFEVEKTAENRANLYAEISAGKDPPIILLNHIDVVPADPKEWSVDPFSGTVKDSYVWGRGAIDCKGFGIMELFAFIVLKREGRLKRNLIYCATADEEMGGRFGAYIASEKLSPRLKGAFVLNEGGLGIKKMFSQRDFFSPDFGEKGPLWIELVSRGKAGHGSMPHPDNANLKLINAIHEIFKIKRKTRVIPQMYSAMDYLKKEEGGLKTIPFIFKILPKSLLKRALSKNYRLSAMFHNTFALTILNGGYKENVIPGSSRAVIDIRVLPGESPDEIVEEIKKRVKKFDVTVNILAREMPSLSEPKTKYMDSIREVIKKNYPDAIFLPMLVPGFTDSRFFRAKGAIAYGFIPCAFEQEDVDRVHGVNERISEDCLFEGTKNIYEIVKALQE